MKSAIIQLGILVLSTLPLTMTRGADAPAPGPEQKQFEKWVGNWNYEGEIKVTPSAPASKLKGTMKCQLILGGFVLQSNWKEASGSEGLEIHSYDPVSKRYRFQSYDSDGNSVAGFERMSGAVWRGDFSIFDSKGLGHRARTELRFGADGQSMTVKWEVLSDGRWAQFMDVKFTKS